MGRRAGLKKVVILGSGPIVIGQACEFDYSGTQACKALMKEGLDVKQESLPKTVQVTHVNLNDHTVAGIYDPTLKVMSVQFHPESHPGPHDASELFDFFIRQTQ